MAEVQVQARAVLEHRKASSSCHGAPLRLPPQGAAHEYECGQCGQPCERVLGEPAQVHARG